MDNKLLYKIALSKIPGIGAVLAKNLESYCHGAEQVFTANRKQLLKVPGIGEKMASVILKSEALQAAEIELKHVEKHDIKVLDHLHEDYPSRLKHFSSSPYILYQKGKGNNNPNRTVAIVGTRKPSSKGGINCTNIVSGLSKYGATVVSGLAYGIDIIAHKACIKEGLPTIGVMGNGFGRIYPSAHIKTAREMMEDGGLLSEFGYEVGPDRENFPARNRIIAGMADAVIVVESASKGGSMITAVFGNEYNKDVFAVPGKPQDEMSAGCNYLIKTQQAYLCESADDVAYVMGWDADDKVVQKSLFSDLNDKEKQILELIKSKDNPGVDTLSYESTIPQSELSGILLNLEFKGCIKVLPGKRFVSI